MRSVNGRRKRGRERMTGGGWTSMGVLLSTIMEQSSGAERWRHVSQEINAVQDVRSLMDLVGTALLMAVPYFPMAP